MPESVITSACADCDQDLEHCHGTAFQHCDGAADCSDDPGCRLPADLHLFVAGCAEVGCDCTAGQPGQPGLAAGQAAS
jgi:hypothetical protein